MTTDPTAADRQPAYDAVFAYIRQHPRDFLPTNVVDRNAMIWRAVNVALDAVVSPPTDRADLRERIAGVLAEADGWKWVTARDKARSSTYRSYQSRADAVLAVLGEPTDRAAVLLEAADHFDRMGRTVLAASQVRDELRRLAVEAQSCRWEHPHPGYQCKPHTAVEAHGTGTHQQGSGALMQAHVALAAQAGKDQAALTRVRHLHDRLAEETDLASPDDPITRGAAAKRIAAALDGWNPSGAPQCDVEFEGGGRCAKPAGHRPPGSDDPHVPAPVAQQPAQDEALREGAVARCDRALAGKTHPPHDWEPDPGNGLWHCPGDEPFAI